MTAIGNASAPGAPNSNARRPLIDAAHLLAFTTFSLTETNYQPFLPRLLNMLGQVIARRRGRRTKRNSLTPQIDNCASPCKPLAQTSKEKEKEKPSLAVNNNRRNNGRRAVQDVSNHKITDYFPEEEKGALRDAVYGMTNEALLEVYVDENKGRGIRAGKSFVKNEFVIEYKGDMMDYASAKIREEEYAKDPSIGSYMYFFKYKSKRWCVDATKESIYKGRLINHSALRPNLRTKVVEFEDGLHLILVAKRDIDEAEELLYDYGDRTPETVARNPWLVNS
ncbi:hypothetical protein Q1695_014761 [Nippostrongylus brasiliensis]|nr:hypothetical protein Q1695_014761 [Nippostrongylus brasiliensis]